MLDPAGFPFIGALNHPGGAGAASGSIYEWLQLTQFPPGVHHYFKGPQEEMAEKRAKYHCYGAGQHVIHVIGPKLYERDAAVKDLATTYREVFTV